MGLKCNIFLVTSLGNEVSTFEGHNSDVVSTGKIKQFLRT